MKGRAALHLSKNTQLQPSQPARGRAEALIHKTWRAPQALRWIFLSGAARATSEKSGGGVVEFSGFQMVGVMRFSVLTTDFNTRKRGGPDEIAARIFREEAMDLRFRLFEALTLPTLLQQSDPEFHLVILTSDQMPRPYLDRLRDLVAVHPGIEVWPAPVDRHYQLLKQAYERVPEDGSGHRLSFRIDDDDAVDLEMVERAKRIGRHLLTAQSDDTPTMLCWNKGFYFTIDADEGNSLTDCYLRAPLAIGTTLMHRPGAAHNPYRFNHRNFPAHYNTYTDISLPGFIRSIHADNSSTPHLEPRRGELKPIRVERQIRRHFGLDAKALLELKLGGGV
ncbi:glycosyltransferase [Pseudooceanicola sp. C21-150M6]|uniref:glycosyltransferase n=1 Tax=Pseudooceanicola sp. C21-150M6 TaxID=3434355 RepID=UPI003D7F88F9